MINLLSFIVSITLLYLVFSLTFTKLFSVGRINSLVITSIEFIGSLFSSMNSSSNLLLVSLIVFLLMINVSGNVPLNNIPTMYYFVTVSISITIWLSIVLVVFNTQFYGFMAHILPFGSPTALMLFLPLVEVFSHLIRPLTLIIRLSTNLSSGHIMIFMFSFFSVSSNLLTFALTFVLLALITLEIMISLLQAYIFSSLMYMYISETH